jgi:hypothetical protein
MNQIATNQDANPITGPEIDQKLDRNMILSWLKADITYLRDKAKQDNPGANVQRIQLLRTSIYGCSVALSALKDDELEMKVKELEEKLKNGILVVNHNEPKR